MISNLLHRLAHWLDPNACKCEVKAWMAGWRRARDMELRALSTPSSPDAMRDEMWIRERAS
jgi:hypothetical protein